MKASLEKSAGLNQQQLEKIRRLEEICNKSDGLTMKLNWSRLKRRPPTEINDFLSYDRDQLVGYLALYSFNAKEAETSAMTHPDYRQQGIFKQLLAAARTELRKRSTPDFLFICERVSISGAATMQAIGARYDFSEYKMIREPDAPRPQNIPAPIRLRPATPADIPTLGRMDEIFFKVPFDSGQRHLADEMADSSRQILVAMRGEKEIGKIAIRLGETETFIYAFGVLPEYRRQGYGRAILNRTVEQLVAEARPHISLEVATDNEQALSLYQQAGFHTTTVYDYYRLPVGR